MTTTTQAPRYRVGDRVRITGNNSRGAVWEVKGILEPTRTSPQWGYLLGMDWERKRGTRTVDEDRLTLAGDS